MAAQLAIKLYELGDRLDVQELKSQARLAFLRAWCNVDKKTHSGLNPEESSFRDESGKAPAAFMNLVREVYTTTHFDDRGLRDIVYRTLKFLVLAHYHFTPKFRFLTLIVEENADLALEVALFNISAARYHCDHCNKSQRFVMYPCMCPAKTFHCEATACVAARRERTFCFLCCRLGTLNPTPVVGPEDIK